MRSLRVSSLAALATLAGPVLVGACFSDPPPSSSVPVIECKVGATLEPAADVVLHVDDDPTLATLRADLAADLAILWGTPVTIATGAPDGSHAHAIWLSTSDAAKAKLAPGPGYAMKREGADVVVTAADPKNLEYAGYALLEELGVRFFHPKSTFLPSFGGPRLPAALDVKRAAWVKSRGIQVHTLHPLEWFPPFMVPSAENLADAKLFVDWLVHTGQNHVQWAMLSSIDFDAYRPHAQAIVDYAHARGVTVGINVQLVGAGSLQNNYVLVKDATGWQAQLEANLDRLLTIGFDSVDLSLGEFFGTDPQSIIDWLTHATQYVAAKKPDVHVNVHNHVGNYENLYVDYQGKKVFYYHLPQYADPNLGQTVHTIAFFDLYRDWGTYAHPNFFFQRDYLMAQLPTRRVRYYPESAYWIGADIDVPLFLPEYVHARWNDVHGLAEDVAKAGLPPLEGHLMFSSGHEWGTWMTDYLTAKMLWEPEQPLSHFFSHVGGAFGSCAGDVSDVLAQLTALQDHWLFDRRLAAYVQGENGTLDVGYSIGIESHPKRIAFEDVLAMDAPARAKFTEDVVTGLEAMTEELRPLERAMESRCAVVDPALGPWCRELRDGVVVDRLRSEHAAALYRAILAHAAKGDPEPSFQTAVAARTKAVTVIARREKEYRFTDGRATNAYPNPTVYAFGYLRPAHDACYWVRQEKQARLLIDEGIPAPIASLPSCQE